MLLRGDMDALPMARGDRAAFASTVPGRMHACGHDTHTAMLAGAARILRRARRRRSPGEVRFMFQPGEEGFHGARFMLDDGLLDPLPDAAFALHIMPNAPHGDDRQPRRARCSPRPTCSRSPSTGRGGHASMPHDTRDPVPVACEIVLALQAMVTRRFDAAERSWSPSPRSTPAARTTSSPTARCSTARSARSRPATAQAVRERDPTARREHRRRRTIATPT